MRIEEQFEIPCAIDRVYADFNDVGQIGYCIAGVKDVHVVSADESRWKIEQRFGFMARTFDLDAKITERRPPELIAFSARGQDVEIRGHTRLQPLDGGSTGCEIVIHADVTGPLAPLVDLMARGPQEQLVRRTIENLRTRMEGLAGEPGHVKTGGPLERLRRWIRRRRPWISA